MATYTDQLYSLFSKGLDAHSPEVKELCKATKHLQSGLHAAFSKWKELGKPDHYPHKETGTGEAKGKDVAALPGATVGGIDTTTRQPASQVAPKEEKPLVEKSNEAEEPPEEEPPQEEPPETPPETPPEEKAKGGIILAFGADEKEIDLDHMEGYALAVKTTLSLKTLMLYQIEAFRRGDNLEVGDFIDECVADYFRGRGVDLGLVDLGGGKDAK